MVTIVSNDGQTRWEKPLSSTDSVDPAKIDFLSGDYPELLVVPMPVFAGVTLKPGDVVQIHDSGQVCEPGFSGPGGTYSWVGIAISGVTAAAANSSVLVARAGCFDPDLLDWGVSGFNPDAFEYAAAPTQIVLRKRIASAP